MAALRCAIYGLSSDVCSSDLSFIVGDCGHFVLLLSFCRLCSGGGSCRRSAAAPVNHSDAVLVFDLFNSAEQIPAGDDGIRHLSVNVDLSERPIPDDAVLSRSVVAAKQRAQLLFALAGIVSGGFVVTGHVLLLLRLPRKLASGGRR